MNYFIARPNTARRSSLLSIVIGAHLAIGLLFLTAKTVAPQLFETPLIVDMIQPAEPLKRLESKPLPVSKPQSAAPRSTLPPIEATSSLVPSASAPAAAPVAVAATASETVSQARFDADYQKNPAPAYPPAARRRGEEGRVMLRVQVSAQGAAEQVEIRTSSGSNRLDEAAAATVSHWKFIPARRGDTPVQSWVLVPIIFKLEQ
jgi:protein TonB